MADALGRTVTTSGVQEASGRWAVLLALEKLGKLEIEEAEAPLETAFEPDPERHVTYSEALRHQRRLYEAVLGAL
jgi:sugar (pentulose or hexulose) kinase